MERGRREELPEIPFGEFRFSFEMEDGLVLPSLPGVLWHSVMGKALHDLSCINPGMNCKECRLLHQCDYPYLFRRIAPPDSVMMRNKEVPVPHVFRYRQQPERKINEGDLLSVDIVLVGDAAERLVAVSRAMSLAVRNGLGKTRSKGQLISVQQKTIDGVFTTIIEEGQRLAKPVNVFPPLPSFLEQMDFVISTPYKPSGFKRGDDIDVSHMLMSIVRRVSLLQYFYTDTRLQADFAWLKSATTLVKVVQNNLEWRSAQRYSTSHGKNIDTSGWLGQLQLDLKNAPSLWPYVFLGQWINMGKNAGMGFGRYEI